MESIKPPWKYQPDTLLTEFAAVSLGEQGGSFPTVYGGHAVLEKKVSGVIIEHQPVL